MRFYTKQHQFYCGSDLQARSMYVCILNQESEIMLHRNMKASPETSTIPVIFVTISSDVNLDHLAYAAGAIACIRKPLRRDALLAVIAAAVKSGRGQGLPGQP